jgi:multidrug transporter EmrE-like cation transporter
MLLHALLYLAYAALNTAAMAAARSAMRSYDVAAHVAAVGWLSAGGFIYLVVLGVLLLLLRDGAASTVFPIAIGCTVVVTNLVGARLYGETFSLRKLIGLLLILAGVALAFADGGSR